MLPLPPARLWALVPSGSLGNPTFFAFVFCGFPCCCEGLDAGSPRFLRDPDVFWVGSWVLSLPLARLWTLVPSNSLAIATSFRIVDGCFSPFGEALDAGSPRFPRIPDDFCICFLMSSVHAWGFGRWFPPVP